MIPVNPANNNNNLGKWAEEKKWHFQNINDIYDFTHSLVGIILYFSSSPFKKNPPFLTS